MHATQNHQSPSPRHAAEHRRREAIFAVVVFALMATFLFVGLVR